MMFSGVTSPISRACGMNKSTSTYKGDYEWDYSGTSYENEYFIMFAFAIVQTIFWTVQCYCCCIPLFTTPVKDKEYEAEKKEKKEAKKELKEQEKMN